MAEQVPQPERPELGFVSLGDYLNANRGTLDRGFAQAEQDAQQWGTDKAGPGGVEGARELSREFGSEAGLAGSGRAEIGQPFQPGSNFNAALSWASHGPGYQGLSSYLGSWQPPAPAQDTYRMDPGVNAVPVQPKPAAPTTPNPGGWDDKAAWNWDPDSQTWKRKGGASDAYQDTTYNPARPGL